MKGGHGYLLKLQKLLRQGSRNEGVLKWTKFENFEVPQISTPIPLRLPKFHQEHVSGIFFKLQVSSLSDISNFVQVRILGLALT